VLKAHAHSLKHLEGSISGYNKKHLMQGMRWASEEHDYPKSLVDFRVMHDRVAMAGGWKPEQKKAWEDQGTATCQEQLQIRL
jgi:hypothetical protein